VSPRAGRTIPVDPLRAAFQRAAGKIDGFAAFGAGMRFVEFVGEDLFALAAFGALADKGFQIFKSFETGTVLRGGSHDILLYF
jgi:hypothetical protein